MVRDWGKELTVASESIREVKRILINVQEHEATRLLILNPFISVLVLACDFIDNNLEVIHKQLAKT